jgi:glutathione synthase/RimK-type ligase-like ATP-grasp enzyme
MRLWCFDDNQLWGRQLHAAAVARGVDARMFRNPYDCDEGYAFVHMHHHPDVRTRDKRVAGILALNTAIVMVPDYRSTLLYDDKAEQARQLAPWMPKTRLLYSRTQALRELPRMVFPFMSKAPFGAGSHNVRLVASEAQALAEIEDVFPKKKADKPKGIKCRYDQRQRGVLLWQDFLEGNDHDLRIIAIGSQRLILRRKNRPNRPMASGSGLTEPIRELDDECAAALEFADRFFKAHNFRWCGIDLVRDRSQPSAWRVLETTVGWTLSGYDDCNFFPSSRAGSDIWNVLLDEIAAGNFPPAN